MACWVPDAAAAALTHRSGTMAARFLLAAAGVVVLAQPIAESCSFDSGARGGGGGACSALGACLSRPGEGGGAPMCACDRGWRGANCSILDLAPAPTRERQAYMANRSSWGGNAIRDPATGAHHLFFSEMRTGGLHSFNQPGHCQLTTAVSPSSPTGPFSHNRTVLRSSAVNGPTGGRISHNVQPQLGPDGAVYIFMITSPPPGPPPPGAGEAAGPKAPLTVLIGRAPRLGAEFVFVEPLLLLSNGTSIMKDNPTAIIYGNGTVIMITRGTSLFKAPSWRSDTNHNPISRPTIVCVCVCHHAKLRCLMLLLQGTVHDGESIDHVLRVRRPRGRWLPDRRPLPLAGAPPSTPPEHVLQHHPPPSSRCPTLHPHPAHLLPALQSPRGFHLLMHDHQPFDFHKQVLTYGYTTDPTGPLRPRARCTLPISRLCCAYPLRLMQLRWLCSCKRLELQLRRGSQRN